MRRYGEPEDGRRDFNERYARMRKRRVSVLRKLFGPNSNDLREHVLQKKEFERKIGMKKAAI